ncbi:hypothetical protein PoB_001826100 [Plakobranchus ocellatus]|uniref:Apple domain-containing protein n=1 Tax=Plakobranchus ocellatus TaxID=259542 RepID=A0AAV3Z790_9GAST|nr:hypothetical protein PoB_001826100 [Plakobranchus ocellatus]
MELPLAFCTFGFLFCTFLYRCTESSWTSVPAALPELKFGSMPGCETGFVSGETPLEENGQTDRAARSEIECALRCRRDARCGAYNFKPAATQNASDEGGSVQAAQKPSCTLLGKRVTSLSCQDLIPHPGAKFKYMHHHPCDQVEEQGRSCIELEVEQSMKKVENNQK